MIERMPNSQPARRTNCPITQFQRIISGKYKLRILWDLKDGPLRYGQLKKGLLRGLHGSPEISPRVLSRELKTLGEMGMLNRKDFRLALPKVEYSLTEKGKSLIPTIAKMHDWGIKHLSAPLSAPMPDTRRARSPRTSR